MTTKTAVEIKRHRFSVEDYYRMAEAGILAPDARVELIEGEVVDMAPIGSLHASVVTRLNRLLQSCLDASLALVAIQNPIRLDQRSEPQPDVCLLKPRADYYSGGHP